MSCARVTRRRLDRVLHFCLLRASRVTLVFSLLLAALHGLPGSAYVLLTRTPT